MPLPVLVSLVPKLFASPYLIHIAIVLFAVSVVRAYAQGRTTDRERDLHGRTILLTVSKAVYLISVSCTELMSQQGYFHVVRLYCARSAGE